MELRHLNSFIAISEELHFSRAANRLHLSQPTLSQQLQRLEKSVGTRLVTRTSHEVRLTPAGEAFGPEARRILARVDRACSAARTAAAGRAGTVRVGCNYPAAQFVLPRVVSRMTTELPAVTVAPLTMGSGPQIDAVLSGDLDVAMISGRPSDRRLATRPVMRMPVVALVGQRHPWASSPELPFARLADRPCVLCSRDQSPALHDLLTQTARNAGFELDVAEEVDDPMATSIVISARNLVGFCSGAQADVMWGGVQPGGGRPVAIPLVDPVPRLDLHLVWRRDESTPLADAFLRTFAACEPFSTGLG